MKNELLFNLVSEWTFDDSANIGEDTWGNHHGTLYNFADPATSTSGLADESECVFGKCLRFDGVDDHIITDLKFPIAKIKEDGLTYSFWMKTSNLERQCMITQDSNSGCWQPCASGVITLSGKASAVIFDGVSYQYIETRSNVRNDKWHHIVAIFGKGLNVSIYLNGQKENEETLTNFQNYNPPNGIIVGSLKEDSTYKYFFNGLMDDVRVYNTALSSAQIKQNYIVGLDSMLKKGTLSKDEYSERLQALASE